VNRLAFAVVALLALPTLAVDRGPPTPTFSGLEAPRGPPLSGAALEARTADVGALLRCPVCQGLSVADSPATMARNMKAEVREKLAAGYDQEQILSYFERSYGEFVRLEPPMHGLGSLVWWGPLAGLLAGGAAIGWALKRAKHGAVSAEGVEHAGASPAASTLPSRDTLPDEPRLAAAVRRVRELAYGWPGGIPPAPSSRS
jgi:cytochrome c-type biogenesis protein CcmH